MGVRIAGVQSTKQSVAFMETANTFQSQSRDRQTACRLSWLCFRDANPHEQEGRQAGLGMGFRIAGVQSTKQSVAFMETANTFQSQSRDRQTACRLSWLCFRDANPHEREGRQAGLGMGVRIAGV